MTMKLQRVERTTYYDLPVYCCFCGHGVVTYQADREPKLAPCLHTLFIAHDMGFEFLSDRAAEQLRSKGFELEFQENGFCEVSPQDEGDNRESPEYITDDLEFTDGVKSASYVGPPSGFGSYVGFAPSDSDYE